MRNSNKHKIILATLLATCTMMAFSCTKEDSKDAECDMLSAWVEGEAYEQYFLKPSDMRVDNISSTATAIVFTVRSIEELPTEVPVYFALTDGATVTPGSGSLQDFTHGPVVYTVTSEDGENQRQYTVEFKQPDTPVGSSYTYSFEGVDSVSSGAYAYHVFYELGSNGDSNYIWASGNQGVALVHNNWRPSQFPTRSVDDGYRGKGVCLSTQDAGDLGRMMGKPLAAGNLFIGTFDISQLLSSALKCTVFGTPVRQEPVTLSGYYKYQPGEVFTDAQMNPVEGRTDEAHIYAVFFRNQNEQGESISLHGDDVQTSPYIVKRVQIASLPATNEWTRFEASFEGDDADAALLAALGYSMTIVFSASKSGATFEGAIGSTLYIDEVTVTFKN